MVVPYRIASRERLSPLARVYNHTSPPGGSVDSVAVGSGLGDGVGVGVGLGDGEGENVGIGPVRGSFAFTAAI